MNNNRLNPQKKRDGKLESLQGKLPKKFDSLNHHSETEQKRLEKLNGIFDQLRRGKNVQTRHPKMGFKREIFVLQFSVVEYLQK
jgi:hypothetical protein